MLLFNVVNVFVNVVVTVVVNVACNSVVVAFDALVVVLSTW